MAIQRVIQLDRRTRVLGSEFENCLDFPVEFHGRVHLGLTALDVGSAREHDGKREPPSHIVRVAFSRTSMGFGLFEDLFPSILVICCPGRLHEHPYGVGHTIDHPCGTLSGALFWTEWDRFLSGERVAGGDQQQADRSDQSYTLSGYTFEKSLSGSHFGLPSPLQLECRGKMRSVRLWQHTSNDVAGERRVRRVNEQIVTSELLG